jgi:cysteine desulfurase/selenocysteine lyase
MCLVPREDFPEIVSRNIIYLDSAASTLKPRQVMEAITSFTLNSYANIHRGVYGLSIEASRIYEEAHEEAAKFIGGSWDEVIFVKNTTEAIQLSILMLAYNGFIKEGDEIIATEADHHSLLLPLARVSKIVGARLKLIPVDSEGKPRWDLLPEMITNRTRIVGFSHKSNVTGYTTNARDIAKIAHEYGALVILDGAQSVPHIPINVKELGIDFIAFSGHKMLGPSGIGVLWGAKEILEDMEPPLGGGGTVKRVWIDGSELRIEWEDIPWRFESGTPPIMEAVGLLEAIRYLRRIGMDRIYSYEERLTRYTVRMLEELREYIEILGPRNPSERSGIVSFTLKNTSPDVIGMWLDRYKIAVRTGLHCAHILHQRVGHPEGSVRASFYVYSCEEDVSQLVYALREYIAKNRLYISELTSSPP